MRFFFDLAEECSDLLTKNLQRSASLICSLKNVSVDKVSGEKREIELGAYLGEVVFSLSPKLRKQGVQPIINAESEIVMSIYPGCLAQVFTNLIMNSITHAFKNENDPRITIELRRSGDEAEIIYMDNGEGMDQSVLSKIYEPFFTTKRNQGGSGLGMNIVFNLVTKNLDGRICCESAKGQGTKFTINLPISTE